MSVIIPTKIRADLLQKCLIGLAQHTDYPDLEVVIVDNGSNPSRLERVVEESGRGLNLVRCADHGDFNFSRLINHGVAVSSGELVLLLNDDVEPFQDDWLVRMVESLLRPDVGCVGARLLYPDRSIQHAGVSMGVGGVAGHKWRGVLEDEVATMPVIVYPGERVALTGACLGVRRQVFQSVGGLDESFAVALNDIDFCLRVRALGLQNIYRGDSVLFHHESQSRGMDDQSTKTRRRLARETQLFFERWRQSCRDDPFTSPAYDMAVEAARVRPAMLRWPADEAPGPEVGTAAGSSRDGRSGAARG